MLGIFPRCGGAITIAENAGRGSFGEGCVATDAITASLILRAVIAIVLGAATHLVWDAFTHRDADLYGRRHP